MKLKLVGLTATALAVGFSAWLSIRCGKSHYHTDFALQPALDVPSDTIDAELATEFSVVLTSNRNLTICNLSEGRRVWITVTNLGFKLQIDGISWLPTNQTYYPLEGKGLQSISIIRTGSTNYGEIMTRTEF